MTESPIAPIVRKRMTELDIGSFQQFCLRFDLPWTTAYSLVYGKPFRRKGETKSSFSTPGLRQLPRLANALGMTAHELLDLYLASFSEDS